MRKNIKSRRKRSLSSTIRVSNIRKVNNVIVLEVTEDDLLCELNKANRRRLVAKHKEEKINLADLFN